ncbi:MAG: hypothetical protein NVS2B4_11940 [Ramlibacter sp.]
MSASVWTTKDWTLVTRRALRPTEVVARLAALPHWALSGDGANVAIEKVFTFANYHQTMAFVNAVAFIAHRQDHHPDLSVHHSRCVVRWRTHDVQGLSETDFSCAAQVDALLA